MSQPVFKLWAMVQAHEKDVRCISAFGSGGFVTGSRDNSGKVFVPSKSGQTLIEAQLLTGAQKYVSCCCVLSSGQPDVPDRIYLGSHDHDVYCFTADESTPVAVLRGHNGPVSALAADSGSGHVLSGSWDMTAILWHDNQKVRILTGHSQSILAVDFLGSDYLLTGSADKSIKCWTKGQAELKETFFGHEDAVRGLQVINADLFMSCSNDGSLRRWSLSRGLVKTYHCHDQYVYAMTWVTADAKSEQEKIGFISCSEDRTAKVFIRGKLVQVIPVPSETLWSVISTSGTEIAIATSSGRVFLFSSNPEKRADQELIQVYQALFDQISISPTEKGGRPLLPSTEMLPETTDEGEKGLVVNGENTDVYMYLRQMPVQKAGGWIKIGFMKGSDAKSMNKNEFEGKLYDYLINVDMEDGQPLLKLPFNVGDDPKEAAIAFVSRHSLPSTYIDTIEQFIISNVVTDGK